MGQTQSDRSYNKDFFQTDEGPSFIKDLDVSTVVANFAVRDFDRKTGSLMFEDFDFG